MNALSLLAGGGIDARASGVDVCPNLHFIEPISPAFSSTEKQLACGQVSGTPGGFPEWHVIPVSQRKFSVQNFLQARDI